VSVELIIRAARDRDNRLTGTVRVADAPEAQRFSGTLELLRVFETLVPCHDGRGGRE
jgi:hypothetical protein